MSVNWYIEDRYPVLKRLQGKTAKQEPYTEHPQASLGKVVGIILDVGIDRDTYGRDQPGYQPEPDGE